MKIHIKIKINKESDIMFELEEHLKKLEDLKQKLFELGESL